MGLSVAVSEPVYTHAVHSTPWSESRPNDCDGNLEKYEKYISRLSMTKCIWSLNSVKFEPWVSQIKWTSVVDIGNELGLGWVLPVITS